MSILSLSHNDLDGLSSQIVLRQHLGEITRMNISYGKIDEYLEIVQEYCSHTRPSQVWITDLSFTYNQLERVSQIANENKNIMFYFIDHHPFKEEYNHLISDNLKILINNKASATKLTHLYLKHNFNNKKFNVSLKDLDEYVEYTNTYDLWLKDEPRFKGSIVYNELFWDFKRDYYFTRFKDEFKLRNADKEKYKELMKKKVKLFDKLDKSGRIFRHEPDGNKRIFMIFLDDYKNHITIDYEGFDVYIIVSSYGGVSIRFRDNLSDTGELKDIIVSEILKHENVDTAGGHPRAFGMKLADTSAHHQVEFAKYLLEVIDKALDEKNF